MNNYKKLVCKYNKLLEEYSLVKWTSWNVSIRVNDKILIKPSWILFSELKYEDISVVDLNTEKLIEWKKFSTDTYAHLLIYKENTNIYSIVHTHSNYATAFAACNKNIPVYLTSMADEFWDEIKCSNYAEIWWKDIWKEVIRLSWKTGVVLLKSHWIFTIWKNIDEAFKKAVMVEDIAKTTFLAIQIWNPIELTREQIEKNNYRYNNSYWQ